MVLSYEENTLYALCKTHFSLVIYNTNVELS